jgi:hypothetical protein
VGYVACNGTTKKRIQLWLQILEGRDNSEVLGLNGRILKLPNVVFKWLTLLLYIRLCAGSNLGPATNYIEFFVVFPCPYRHILG